MSDRTVDDVYDQVLNVKAKVIENTRLIVENNGHIIALKEHVNDSLELMRADIALKQDSSSLLRSVGFQALNNRAIRWVLGALAVSAFATVVSSHWIPWLERIAQFFRLV